jgi:prepilin-type N-terminal cleavage/methylation domain-containing protein
MPRRSPPGGRRAFTLLELLVVLVLLGLSTAVVLPAFRLPAPAAVESPLARARTLAVRRGEALRLELRGEGRWQLTAAADTAPTVLLDGDGMDPHVLGGAQSVLVTALGTCLPEGPSPVDGAAWDPVRCGVTSR